jgi:hypothetical protein
LPIPAAVIFGAKELEVRIGVLSRRADSSSQATAVQGGVSAGWEANMEATVLAASVLVIAGAIVWSMLNAREHPSPE